MIMDAFLLFDDNAAITASRDSTNVVDLGPVTDNTTRDIGTGEDVYLIVQVGTVLDSAGEAATLTIALKSDSTADMDTSETVHYTTAAIAEASCTAGAVLAAIKLPSGSYERYLGLEYVVGTENFTSGTISAFLTKDVNAWRAYADRITIS